jgi:hypothetical protein
MTHTNSVRSSISNILSSKLDKLFIQWYFSNSISVKDLNLLNLQNLLRIKDIKPKYRKEFDTHYHTLEFIDYNLRFS